LRERGPRQGGEKEGRGGGKNSEEIAQFGDRAGLFYDLRKMPSFI